MMQQKKSDSAVESALSDAEELRELVNSLMRRLQACEQHYDLQGQLLPSSYAQALMVLHDFSAQTKDPTLSDLVELLHIDKSNVTRLCQRLHDAGHVIVARDEHDRRAKRIALSSQGQQLARHLHQTSVARYEAILESLSPDDRHIALDTLTRLVNALEDHA